MRKKLEWPNYLQSDRADPDGDRKDGGDGKKVRTASILINQSHWDPTISTEKVHLGDKRKVQLKNKNFLSSRRKSYQPCDLAHPVSGSTVLGLVHTLLFSICGNTQHSCGLQGKEENSRQDTGPGSNGQNTKELNSNLLTTSGSSCKEPVVLLRSQKASGDDTPCTAEEVDWTGTQRIINLQHQKKLASVGVHNTSNKSNDEGRPWFSDVATGGDTDKSSQDSI